jgi:hypothetical protein
LRSHGFVSPYSAALTKQLIKHIDRSFKLKLSIFFKKLEIIISSIQSSGALLHSATNPKANDVLEVTTNLEKEIKSKEKILEDYDVESTLQMEDIFNKLCKAYASQATSLKKGWDAYALKIVGTHPDDEKYRDYVKQELRAELLLRLDTIDNQIAFATASKELMDQATITLNKIHHLDPGTAEMLLEGGKIIFIGSMIGWVGMVSMKCVMLYTHTHTHLSAFKHCMFEHRLEFH